jgi:hypothetical protein
MTTILRCSLALAFSAVLVGLGAGRARAQSADADDAANAAKGADLMRKAIEARGGSRYVGFKSVVTSGQYTPFDEKGVSTIPTQFIDYIVYPDKERTDFGKGRKKDRKIQVNVGTTGWVYDGDAQTLKDQNEAQLKDFLEGQEFDIDRLLRGGWQQPGVSVRFGGREETRPGERADVVVLKLRSGATINLLLDSNTHLPISLVYEQLDSQTLKKNEVRFAQWVPYEGVKFPNIVDFYRDGIQRSRINLDKVQLDGPVDETMFAKPANIKAIK